MLVGVSIALTGIASSLRVFGNERIVFWREASTGTSTLAYFLGKDFAQIPNMLIAPLLFEVLYYSLTVPRAHFLTLYYIFILVEFASVSIGYLVSCLVKPAVSQLSGVVVVLVMMMFSGSRPTLSEFKTMVVPVKYIPSASYLRWSQESIYIAEVSQYAEVYDITSGLNLLSYSLDDFHKCLIWIAGLGLLFRICAFIAMVALNRDKKK